MCKGENGNYIQIYKSSECSICHITDWKQHCSLALCVSPTICEILLTLISKLSHSSVTHLFIYSANMLAMLAFDRTATTSTVPAETLQPTS
jgi:hypothetical protein